jgi:uncharacterized protein (UPF0335 family)
MKKKVDNTPMTMVPGGNSALTLKEFADRLVSMETQILAAVEQHVAPLRGDRKDIYEEAVANGFDRKALKEVVRKIRMEAEMRMLIDTYEIACIEDIMG